MPDNPASPPQRMRMLSLAIMLAIGGAGLAKDTSAGDCGANGDGELGECPVPRNPEAQPQDWVKLRDVPDELLDERCLRCEGRYVDPLRDLDRSVDPSGSDIAANGGSTELVGDTIQLRDGVEVRQGYRQLSADSATLNRLERTGELSGNITLREPGLLLRGQRASIDASSGEAQLDESEFLLHDVHLRGQASALERDSDGILHIHDGELSYCAPGEEDWSIQAEELELDTEEGLGVAHGAKLRVGGVPVFYFPWMQFPIDDRRRTGVLWPDIGSDSKGGIDISTPVYVNLAPNYDLLYSPRYIQERGLNHEVQGRYLSPVLGQWLAGGAYLEDDKRYQDEFPDQRSDDRWLAVVKQNGLFQQRIRSRVDYSRVSDPNYMKDLETASLDSKRRTSLLQLGALDYLGDNWIANLEVQQFQSLADDINNDYKKLPQLSASYRPDGTPFEFDPVLMVQYSSFDTDDDRVTGDRVYAEAGASYPMLWGFGFLNSTAKYRQLQYELNDHVDFSEDKPSAGSAMASIDGGLFFDRPTQLWGKELIQTLEPRAYYLYSGYEDQTDQPDFDSSELTFTYNQLFRETRFAGHDRIDDANQLSMGVTTRFVDAEDGREEFSASFGQIFYFRDREVRLDPRDEPLVTGGSEMAGELAFFPNERLGIRGGMVWDPYTDKTNAGNVLASYTQQDGTLYNVGYSYRRPLTVTNAQPPTEQAHFSTYFPVNRNWALFMGINYSVEAHTSVEDMIGVEYDSCCWKLRVLHLRYYDNIPGRNPGSFDDTQLEREHSTQVQIVLKGMGGFGSRVTSIMTDMIRGFTDSEY